MKLLFVFVFFLVSCVEKNSSSSGTTLLNRNDSTIKKNDVKDNLIKTNVNKEVKNNTIKDFISKLDISNVLSSEISMDFACLGIYGNEFKEHYDLCVKQKYSLYTYDTLWTSDHLNGKTTNKPIPAFLTKEDYENNRYIPESYSRLYYDENFLNYINEDYHYHVGNGFAFNSLNHFDDFNNDGYLDLKIKYTITSGYGGTQHVRAVVNETNFAIKEEYERKIKEKTINNSISLNQYISMLPPEDYGFFGIGFLTKTSKEGLLLFYKE